MCITLRTAYIASSHSAISSSTIPASFPKASALSNDDIDNVRDTLKSHILEVSAFHRRSATMVLQIWVDLGHMASIYDLRHISRQLLKRHRYKHTLELGEIQEAENIFREWESNCRKYDIRVSNVLLGAYKRKGLMEKAELLHLRTLQKGGRPNYKTWEILMEGWVEERKMDKAIAAMENGIAMLEHCEWRPSSSIVLAIAVYYENNAKFEEAKQYLTSIRRFRLASLPVYKSLLRMHVSNQSPANDILEMMQKDKIDMDDEILKLVQALPDVSLGIDVK